MLTRTFRSNKARTRKQMTVVVDGALLREVRMSAGLSQEDVARAIGKTKAAVSQMELEQMMPSVETALAMQELFGVALHDSGALKIEVSE